MVKTTRIRHKFFHQANEAKDSFSTVVPTPKREKGEENRMNIDIDEIVKNPNVRKLASKRIVALNNSATNVSPMTSYNGNISPSPKLVRKDILNV